MALVTGTPIGSITTQEEIYLEGAPTIFIQDYTADPLNNPDGDGYYWGMSGTSSYPVYELGCVTDVSFTENITFNDVLCDDLGVKDTVQSRNYFEFTLSIQSFFPFSVLRHLIKGGSTPTDSAPTSKFGLGKINNAQAWMVYAPKVYDEDNGDYVWFHLHRAKFTDAFSINMTFGENWTLAGLRLRAYVDSTKPAAQQFGMFGRADASVIT